MSLAVPTPINLPENFAPGIGSRVIIETTGVYAAFAVESGDMDYMTDDEDITHSESGGWQSSITGIKRANVTLVFVYDFANKPHLSPYQLRPGLIAHVHIVLDAFPTPDNPTPLATQDFHGTIRFNSFRFPFGAKTPAVRVTATGKSNGIFYVPTV